MNIIFWLSTASLLLAFALIKLFWNDIQKTLRGPNKNDRTSSNWVPSELTPSSDWLPSATTQSARKKSKSINSSHPDHWSQQPEHQAIQLSLKKPSRQEKDKAAAAKWANKILNAPEDHIIIDTETTGVNEQAEVIEIGIISCTGEVLLEQRFNPVHLKSMPTKAKQVHGIGLRELRKEPAFSEACAQINDVIRGKAIIIYNAEFDYRLLMQTAEQYGVEIELPAYPRIHCAMLKYSQFVGEWNDYFKNYKWQKLPGGTHGAIGDCKATLAVIKKMAASDSGGA